MSDDNTKIINFRSLLLVAVFCVASILFCYLIVINPILSILLLIAQLSFLVVLFLIYIKSSLYKCITIVICFIASCVCVFNFFNCLFTTSYVSEDNTHSIKGIITAIDEPENKITISNATINGVYENCSIVVYTDFNVDIILYTANVDDELIFNSTLKSNKVLNDDFSINAYAYKSGIKYYSYNQQNVTLGKNEASLITKINEKLFNMLVVAMGYDAGTIAYSMLTGDSSYLTEDVSDFYSASGIGHVLAISGLHIGFIVMLLVLVFKKLKVNVKIANPTIIGLILLYAFYTGFSPSATRAVLMTALLLVSPLLGKRYDALNSLGGAIAIILMIHPLYLFDAGFLLSVGAILSIAIFVNPLTRLLAKLKIPKPLCTLLSLSISVQLGIIPVTLCYFNTIAIYSVLVNIVLVPLVTFTFMATIIGLMLALIIPVFSILLQFVGLLYTMINIIAMFVAGLPLSYYYTVVNFDTIVILICFVAMFMASRFVNYGKDKIKKIISSVMIVILLSIPTISMAVKDNRLDSDYVIAINSYADITTVVKHNKKHYIVGDASDYSSISTALTKTNTSIIEALVLTKLSTSNASEIVKLCKRYNIKQIYSYDKADIEGLKTLASYGITIFDSYSTDDMLCDFIMPIIVSEKLIGYEVVLDNGSMVLCSSSSSYLNVPVDIIDRSYLIRCFMYLNTYKERIFITNASLGFMTETCADTQYSSREVGTLIFDYVNGMAYRL